MNIIDIINKKKNKEILTSKEINYVVENYMNDNITDYQMSSLLMAIVINGMNEDETFNLTDAMIKSGKILDLSGINGVVVDKHSTGGIGDKTSLVVLPIATSLGVKIAKMSGRGLGFTGGTIDKLESIKGFKTDLKTDTFIKNVNNIGMSLISQTEDLVPADKKIYALRDVTGTTESIPLIASSIMSKKIASGADKILLDVKVGKGAFMKNITDATLLAKEMVKIGKRFNKETIAVLTNMDYPLGRTIGNSLEVIEAINTLDNKGETRFTELCLHEASYMVSMAKNIDIKSASMLVEEAFLSKKGLEKFKEFVSAQGGDINKIKVEEDVIKVVSSKEGYVRDIDSLNLAKLCNDLGAGRKNKKDVINEKVGIRINKLYGDFVNKGDILFEVYTKENLEIKELEKNFILTKEKPQDIKIIYKIIK